MARIASLLKGGFFPAPNSAVDMAAQYLKPPDSVFSLLDPCAGVGDAVNRLATHLFCSNVYAIELDEGRAARLKENRPDWHTLGPASFLGCAVTAKSMSCIWLNPPYQDEIGGGGRVELSFLARATRLLVTGGILVFICPEHVSDSHDIRDLLRGHYTDIRRLPFPKQQFGEVIVLARKRSKPIPWYQAEPLEYDAECGIYEIPASGKPKRFEKTELTELELAEKIKHSPLNHLLEPPAELDMPSPPLELGPGHRGMLLASGQLNGVVDDGVDRHLVRGVSRKVEFLDRTEQRDHEDGSVTNVSIYSQRLETSVRAVAADGEIFTFK